MVEDVPDFIHRTNKNATDIWVLQLFKDPFPFR
jgi:hypothetical protein